MLNNRISKLTMICVSVVIILIGMFMQYYNAIKSKQNIEDVIQTYSKGSSGISDKEISSKEGSSNMSKYVYKDEKYQVDEIDIEPETYTKGVPIEIYFTNTEQIEGNFLPIEAHKEISKVVQNFLTTEGYDKAKELEIIDDTAEKDDEKASFECYVKEYENVRIKISFIFSNASFDCSVVHYK